MKFEEQFPSLKGLEGTSQYEDQPCFNKEDIAKYCFDKQKVNEAIDKAVDKIEMYPYKQMKGLEQEAKDSIKKDIKKELGLE